MTLTKQGAAFPRMWSEPDTSSERQAFARLRLADPDDESTGWDDDGETDLYGCQMYAADPDEDTGEFDIEPVKGPMPADDDEYDRHLSAGACLTLRQHEAIDYLTWLYGEQAEVRGNMVWVPRDPWLPTRSIRYLDGQGERHVIHCRCEPTVFRRGAWVMLDHPELVG